MKYCSFRWIEVRVIRLSNTSFTHSEIKIIVLKFDKRSYSSRHVIVSYIAAVELEVNILEIYISKYTGDI